ncbi:recombination protein Saw1 [Schizosaccharomyces cryophilus OY26]|uniref:Recombination protein Saw1 n=1 Tax=Schizosaccharomyces cryophilus (strain OY26 / ATCC MYA-4695 / CBS 11777 / NBRC 106824 / NRRL Y48691) TaxID=653667 RepID=S9VTJ2_SCHCR|nr:recombination protein Saw1 [Schizosaccharomyces cryophilus OY26]EPY49360.1 recombination protein Saw1 [Schizosaccharomyces cryophilus OY26]
MNTTDKIVRLRHNLKCHVRIHFNKKYPVNINDLLFSVQRDLHAVAFLNQGNIRTIYDGKVIDVYSEAVQGHALVEIGRKFVQPEQEGEEDKDLKPKLELQYQGSMSNKIVHVMIKGSFS